MYFDRNWLAADGNCLFCAIMGDFDSIDLNVVVRVFMLLPIQIVKVVVKVQCDGTTAVDCYRRSPDSHNQLLLSTFKFPEPQIPKPGTDNKVREPLALHYPRETANT
jgi:hypothetical protein